MNQADAFQVPGVCRPGRSRPHRRYSRMITKCFLAFIVLSSAQVFACAEYGPDPEKHLRPDYVSYMLNGKDSAISKYIDVTLKNDFMFTFPEGELKQKIIREFKATTPNGTFLLSASYEKDRDQITISTASFGCNHLSSHMRQLYKSTLFSNIEITAVTAFKDFGHGSRATIQIQIRA